MSDLFEVNQNINAMNANIQVLADQVATVAVSLDRLIQTVERSERVAERNAQTIAEQTRIAAENSQTFRELVSVVNRLLERLS